MLHISETTSRREPQRHTFTAEGVKLPAAEPGWDFVAADVQHGGSISDNSG